MNEIETNKYGSGMEISGDDIERLLNWPREGRRCVSIEVKNYSGCNIDTHIWLWDYDAEEGVIFTPGDRLPTTEGLVRSKSDRLLSQLLKQQQNSLSRDD